MMIIKKAFFNNQESRTQELFDRIDNLDNWEGLKTFEEGIETNTIEGEPTISGLKIDDVSSINQVDFLGSGVFNLSASEENLKRVTDESPPDRISFSRPLVLNQTFVFEIKTNMDLPTVRYEDRMLLDPPDNTIEGLPFYDWTISFSGFTIKPPPPSFALYQHKISYNVENLTKNTSFSGIVDNVAMQGFNDNYTVCRLSLGSGIHRISITPIFDNIYGEFTKDYGFRFNYRRTFYPIKEGDKIQALNSNYDVSPGAIINFDMIEKYRTK